jgi:kynurenine formamidase
MIICLPLKIKGLSESPVRVLAIYDKKWSLNFIN